MAIIGSQRPEEEDGPIAVRDFPDGCSPMERVRNKRLKQRQEPVNEQEPGETPGLELPFNFQRLSARDQSQERRKLFGRLMKSFEYKTRADLASMEYMNKRNLSLDFDKVGPVPGVEIGDSFNYRNEMAVVGLHRLSQAGIACVEHQGVRVACAVVVSGGYEDDEDQGEVIWYTGQGGQDYKIHQQTRDQVDEKGNLALQKSCEKQTPVRVIRGHNVNGKQYKRYSYDGLYVVKSHEFTEGAHGFKVHKFKLVRCQDQPKLDTSETVSFDHQR